MHLMGFFKDIFKNFFTLSFLIKKPKNLKFFSLCQNFIYNFFLGANYASIPKNFNLPIKKQETLFKKYIIVMMLLTMFIQEEHNRVKIQLRQNSIQKNIYMNMIHSFNMNI